MTTINAAAEAARESARTATGEFGAQEHTTPETKLIVNGTTGEQRLEELLQQFDDADLRHDDKMRLYSYAFPSAAADVAAGIGAEQVRFEYFQLEQEDPVEARVATVVINGEAHTVDWETDMDDLTGQQLDLRLLGERMYSMTRLFVRDDDDLDIPGLEYDYDDFGMRRFPSTSRRTPPAPHGLRGSSAGQPRLTRCSASSFRTRRRAVS